MPCSFLPLLGVSPGFTPRPSLSGDHRQRRARWRADVSPGFTPRPSLSAEREAVIRTSTPSVAGVHAPAFVERTPDQTGDQVTVPPAVSPGFTPRPSLSDGEPRFQAGHQRRCRRGSRPGLRLSDAGHPQPRRRRGVSPGFTPRPFVERTRPPADPVRRVAVSPGFTPRPSLSGRRTPATSSGSSCVAGVHAPAFVADCRLRSDQGRMSSRFTPRPSLSARRCGGVERPQHVSPGFTPRPSLSGRVFRT